jgi:hypothetical protein
MDGSFFHHGRSTICCNSIVLQVCPEALIGVHMPPLVKLKSGS